MSNEEKGKKFKSINISRENYDTMVEMANWNTSMNDILTTIMKKANIHSSAASALETKDE